MRKLSLLIVLLLCGPAFAGHVLVEAESFADHGGWKLDTQFIEIMGSPYLLAHGLGQPVKDATTTVAFPSTGKYRVFVRTKDWVARWKAPGQPGRFQLLVSGRPLAETFGAKGAEWFWHDGGTVHIDNTNVKLALHDLTGFEGRCDAILFTNDLAYKPTNDSKILPTWRRTMLGLPDVPIEKNGYDLIVVGGGYAGMGAAISAARMGCKVALIQNRPVLGGNGSSEIRVWAQGDTRRGPYPHIGEIIEELSDHARLCPGPAEIYEDEKKLRIVRAEKNIDLFLNHHAYKVDVEQDRITAVYALDTRSSSDKRFVGRLVADCTGHGTIGALAGADFDMTRTGHMGMTNLWRWRFTDSPKPFPAIDWALDLEEGDFPYPGRPSLRGGKPDAGAGEWFWETGFHKHPIDDLEYMRDTNMRAMYGAFNALKNRGAYAKRDPSGKAHATAELIWSAHIGGPRESRRLLGDVVLSKSDVVDGRSFKDAMVPTTWSIDLHHPKKQYAKKFPDNPFISYATFEHRVLHKKPYIVPYRCFYSRNISNLFMAGRCASVTHEALGTVRVMKTGGMMGEVVGRAAAVCTIHKCSPRDVYQGFLDELIVLIKLPGNTYRPTTTSPFVIPPVALRPPPTGSPRHVGVDPARLGGIVIDDSQAKLTGRWIASTYAPNFVGTRYLHDDKTGKGDKSIRYDFKVPRTGRYEVRLSYTHSTSRATKVPVTLETAKGAKIATVNQQTKPPLPHGFVSLGVFDFDAKKTASVVISNRGTVGHVIADAVHVIEAK